MDTQDTPFYTAWLLLADKQFLKEHRRIVPSVYPRGSLRYIVGKGLALYNEHQQLINADTLRLMAEADPAGLRREQTDVEAVTDTYRMLDEGYAIPREGRDVAHKACHEWLERRLLTISMSKAEEALERGDTTEARAVLERSVIVTDKPDDQISVFAGAKDFLTRMRKSKPGAIPTGFYDLDLAWDGGYRAGEVGMVVAPTGVGKSMCLCAMAASAYWHGAGIMYFTFELTPGQIRERISLGVLERGLNSIKGTWDEELTAAAKRRKVAVPDSVIDIRGGTKSWPDVIADIESYRDEWGAYPDVIFLDSADDVAPLATASRKQGWEQLRDAFTYLRSVASEKKIRVWTTGQLNRQSVEKARVNLRYMGDSFGKVQKSHYCIGFAQTEWGRDQDGEDPLMMAYILKDSLWGTTGNSMTCRTMFGKGRNGYPGFYVEKTTF